MNYVVHFDHYFIGLQILAPSFCIVLYGKFYITLKYDFAKICIKPKVCHNLFDAKCGEIRADR